jgi:Cd2+/Zn2+-exporting ATPase
MIKKVIMKNLICSGCAGRIEKTLASELYYVNSASFNFPNQVMLLDVTDEYNEEVAIPEIKTIVDSIEDGVETYSYDKRHLMETKKSVDSYKTFFIGLSIYALVYIIGLFTKTDLSHTAVVNDPLFIWYTPLFLIGYGFIAFKIFHKTLKGLKRKEIFNENTLMFIATLAAVFLRNYFEASLVIIFYTVGEYLQHRAVHRSKQEVSSLMDLKIEYANILVDGNVIITDPLSIKKGDVIIVKNGEKIPVDGEIINGTTSLNTSALTGESKLSVVKIGDYVLSGNINVGNVIEMTAKKEYTESTLAKIIDLIENSTNNRSRTENFITSFAKYYTPAVTIGAILLVLLKTVFDPNFEFIWSYFQGADFQSYVYDAATFLVISCPCALVLSIPLSYFAGIGAAAKQGILFKGSSYIHGMTHVDTIGIDKTGTLTHGNFKVDSFTNKETLKIAASIERFSNHPIAKSIVDFYKGEYYDYREVEEIPGYGLVVQTEHGKILAGNRKLMNKHKIRVTDKKIMVGSNVFISKNGKYIGHVIVKDTLKTSSMNTIRRLARKYNITMLTGDNQAMAKEVSYSLGNIDYRSDLLPEQKIEAFNEIESKGLKMYVGDGINDAPLLKNADIGVAMGNGSELAIDVADVIIMGDDINLLEKAFRVASKTKRIVIENIVLSLTVKFLFLTFAGFGMSSMLTAIFADVGITLIAVLNTFRLIYNKEKKHGRSS